MFGRVIVDLIFKYGFTRSPLFVVLACGLEVALSGFLAVYVLLHSADDWFLRYGVGLSLCLYCFYSYVELLAQKKHHLEAQLATGYISPGGLLRSPGLTAEPPLSSESSDHTSPDGENPVAHVEWYESKLLRKLLFFLALAPFLIGIIIIRLTG